jgi:hypothetical protein
MTDTTKAERIAHYLRTEYKYAHDLASAVGVDYPDNNASPGGEFLLGVRDALINDAEYILDSDYPEDTVSEIVDNLVPVYTHAQWQAFTDLCLYRWDAETVRLNQHTDVSELAQSYLAEVASTLASILWDSAVNATDDDEEDDEEDDE